MGNKKIVSWALVTLLMISTLSVLFTGNVMGQTYLGEITPRDVDGTLKNEFLEGDLLYFKVSITENANATETSVTLKIKDENGITEDQMSVTTGINGIYESWEQDPPVYFDLSGYQTGTYTLNISHPVGDHTNATFEVFSNYAHGSSVETWHDNAGDIERENFVRGSLIYYDGYIRDAFDEPLEWGNVDVGIFQKGEANPVSDHTRSTLTDGYFSSSFMVHQNWDYDDYYLNVTYDYGGDIGEQVVASKQITIYEPDYTDNSIIVTTDSDYSTEKDYFFENEYLYYHLKVLDQHGWTPEMYPDDRVRVFLQKHEEEPYEIGWHNLDNLGSANRSFYISHLPYDELKGDYDIFLYSHDSDISDGEIKGTLYASDPFYVISMDIYIHPSLTRYTQGQDIEIRIESNLPDEVDITIVSQISGSYEILQGAEWEDQEFLDEFWNADYRIPSNTPDGEYYVVVNRSDDGRFIGSHQFTIRKYTLDVETEKEVYLPGETVRAYYTIENILDGSQSTGVTVQWRVTYRNETNDEVMFKGTTTQGWFSFMLPEDARTNHQFIIEVWANHTSGHTHDRRLTRYVGRLSTDITLDDHEYLPGQTIYLDVVTSANYYGWNQYLGYADLKVELLKDGDVLGEYTVETSTDSSGHRTIWIELSDDIEAGIYTIRANGTYNDNWDEDEEQFEVVDLSRVLTIHLRTDKGGNHYYPGDTVTITYSVTRQGEIVTGANVKYYVSDSQKVHAFEYASGGSIVFEIPTDYNPETSGNLEVSVYARYDQETVGWNEIAIPVDLGRILINSDDNEFEKGGDNLTFRYELLHIPQGSIDTIEYRVYNAYGHIVKMGTPVGGMFGFSIPQNPTEYYTGSVTVLTTGGNTITANIDIAKRAGYLLSVNILTGSDYTTGVFVPGQKLRVSYELISRGNEPLPETIQLSYRISGEDFARTISTQNTSGVVEITIPQLEDGEYYLNFNAQGFADNGRMFEVENEPSWVNKNSAINGLNQFGFLILILLIIALLLGTLTSIIVLFRRPKSMRQKEPRRREPVEREEVPYEEPEPEMVEDEGYIIEEGEPEPEDRWQAGDQIEKDEDMEW